MAKMPCKVVNDLFGPTPTINADSVLMGPNSGLDLKREPAWAVEEEEYGMDWWKAAPPEVAEAEWVKEEEEKWASNSELPQDMFLLMASESPLAMAAQVEHWIHGEEEPALQIWPPLKLEPLSAVFVGPEPGTTHSAADFVDAAAYPNHQQYHHHHHGEQQQEEFWMEQPFDLSQIDYTEHSQDQKDYSREFVFATPQPHHPHMPHHQFHHLQQQQQQHYGHSFEQPHQFHHQEHEHLQFVDISESTTASTSAVDQQVSSMFEPLSVCSSACTWSSGGEEHSSQSQDEILEEIQRECAEIEQRSSSSSPREEQQQIAGTSKTIAKKTTRKGSTTKAKKPDRGERKKELNRVAATRYREKKRKEREEIGGEMLELEERNQALKADIAAVQAEMSYLKGLAKEIEAARLKR